MDIANFVLWYWRFSQQFSLSVLVALAGYTPHMRRARRVCRGCVGNCGIRHRGDEAALASQQGCRNFRRPWRDDLVDQRQHGLTGTRVSTEGSK
jgi:hypothetical protein